MTIKEPLKTYTVQGEVPIVLSVYQPTVTMRVGDGPETTLDHEQVLIMTSHFLGMSDFFASGEPAIL